MQKKILGLGLVLAANGALAQSAPNSVELYGIIDITFAHVENSLSTDGNYGSTVNPLSPTKTSINTGVNGLVNGGIQGSRWGLRGNEDLGGGIKAFFTLESGFNAQDGAISNGAASLAANSPHATTVSSNSSLSGQLFNRQAFVGLSSTELGSIAVGRNYNFIYDVVANYDPVFQAQSFSPLGVSSTIGGGGGISENTRVDNSIKYKINFGPVNAGVLYKLGGTAGNSSAGSAYIFNLGYEDGPFGIQGVYESFTDTLKGSASTTAGAVNVTNYNEDAYFVAAKYNFGDITVRGGYESYTLKAPSDAFASLGASYYGFPIANAAAASANFSAADQTTKVWFIGGDYNITPALNLAIGFYDQNPNASSDNKQMDGNVYSYSALLDYHFSKRTDVYAGVLYSQYKGAQYSAPFVAGGDNTSNYILGTGMRLKF